MVNRLMDLVVLVAEMSQKSDKSFKEMDKELSHLGYSEEEIEQAIFWMTSQARPVDGETPGPFVRGVFRVLSPWEATCLDSDAHGYLLRLQNLGIVDGDQFERIMSRILPFATEKLQLPEVKALAGSVIFNVVGEEGEEELFQLLDDEKLVT